MKNPNGNKSSSDSLIKQSFLLIAFSLMGFILIFPLSAFLTQEYCSKTKQDECVGVLQIKIPNNVFGSLIGSMTGAVLSFVAFSILEENKNKRDDELREQDFKRIPKPDIKAYFFDSVQEESEENKFEHFVEVNAEHKIYKDGQVYNVGKVFWVRIKVKNEGGVVAKQCRAYLTRVSKFPGAFSKQKSIVWENVNGFSNSMPLLWAYERQTDYFIVGTGINLPSKASYFADVLVVYNPRLNVQSTKEDWFVKTKSKPHPHYHWENCKIEKNADMSYRYDIEVYADECDVSKISVVAEHINGDNELYFYSLNEKGERISDDKLKSTELPQTKDICFFVNGQDQKLVNRLSSSEIEELYGDL